MESQRNPDGDRPLQDDRRFALYFAPARDSALDRFGRHWFFRDVWTGAETAPPPVAALSAEDVQVATASPRLYGFHATLKPPFRLAPGKSRAMLLDTLSDFTASYPAFLAPALTLRLIEGFFALVFPEEFPPMCDLADACVREFDSFRAYLPDDIERRKKAYLTSRQMDLLERWGYPYVMEEWRFHMTLTGRLSAAQQPVFRESLLPLVEPLCREPLLIEAICLFEQPTSGAPFLITERFPLQVS